MRPFELLRSAPFRLAMAFAVALTGCTIVIFGFVDWQTIRLERERIGSYLTVEATAAAQEPTAQLMAELRVLLIGDLRRVSYGGLYDSKGGWLVGNVLALPPDLPVDCKAYRLNLPAKLTDRPVQTGAPIMLVACGRPDGSVLLLGKDLGEVVAFRAAMLHALELGLIPTVILALAVGAFVSSRALRRIRLLQQTIGRIMRGHLHERLPTHGRRDDLDRLSERINLMLDEIENLLSEVRSIGDNIAHDLRTPLQVVRMKLERAAVASDLASAEAASRSAIADLDKVFTIITALLRITEIENHGQCNNTAEVDLCGLVAEVFDLYEPLAEARGLTFTAFHETPLSVKADRSLLLEALANLVDNAIKFTSPGGRVMIAALLEEGIPVIRISDTGPGIPEAERPKVVQRFFRSDKSRHIPGHGLGLSIVAAIAKRHGFLLRMTDNQPGIIFDLLCQEAVASRQADIAVQ